MKQNKRKAFTLTELLVVVIVLAVLAAVAMPKFRRTLETRRTTEAENMLSAIRTEQEKRCIMGYDYQTDATKLGALAKAGSSQHYEYSLQSTGATATTEGYNLQIPSYKDGRICCSGEGCEALNKNYPSCESITVEEDECAASVPAEPNEPEPEETCTNGDTDSIFGEVISGTCHDTWEYFRTCVNDHWQIGSSHEYAQDPNCCRPGYSYRDIGYGPMYAGTTAWISTKGRGQCRTEMQCTPSGEKISGSEMCTCYEPGYTYNVTTDECELASLNESCTEDTYRYIYTQDKIANCIRSTPKILHCVNGTWQETTYAAGFYYMNKFLKEHTCECDFGYEYRKYTTTPTSHGIQQECFNLIYRPCGSISDESTWVSSEDTKYCRCTGSASTYDESTGLCVSSLCESGERTESYPLKGFAAGTTSFESESALINTNAGRCTRKKYVTCDANGGTVLDHVDDWECTCDEGYVYSGGACVAQ